MRGTSGKTILSLIILLTVTISLVPWGMKPVWAAKVGVDPITIQVSAETVQQQPTFELGVSPLSTDIGISSGNLRTFAVQAQTLYGFTSEITFWTEGVPDGISSSWTSKVKSGTLTASMLTLTCSATAKLGSYNFKVIGTGGGITKSVSVALEVKQTAGPDETLGTTQTIGPIPTTVSPQPSLTWEDITLVLLIVVVILLALGLAKLWTILKRQK